MGCVHSCCKSLLTNNNPTTTKQLNNSVVAKDYDQLKKIIDLAKERELNKHKIVLLGTDFSGKSTILKQLKIAFSSTQKCGSSSLPPYDDEEELRMYGVIVRSNIITAMRKLCQLIKMLNMEEQLVANEEASPTLSSSLSSSSLSSSSNTETMTLKEAYDMIRIYLVDGVLDDGNEPPPLEEVLPNNNTLDDDEDWVGHSPRAGLGPNNDVKLFLHLWRHIDVLWKSQTMKEVWKQRAKVNMIDGHEEFLQDLSRIASPTYKPTTRDILLTRIKTTQVVMNRYILNGMESEFYEFAGARRDHQEWAVRDNDFVDAFLFVVALSEFDQYDPPNGMNRMLKSLNLFQYLCTTLAKSETTNKPVVLLLNKKDVFAEKIMYSNIQDQPEFQDYSGPPGDFNHGVQYFIERFQQCLCDNQQQLTDSNIHLFCATDLNCATSLYGILDSLQTTIMKGQLTTEPKS